MNQTDEVSAFEGLDLRNYGEIKGLESCRELGAQILNCDKDLVWAMEIVVYLNVSILNFYVC